MTGVDSRVGLATDNLADRLSDIAWDAIGVNCGKDDPVNTGVRHPIVDKMVVGVVVAGSIGKFVFIHEVHKECDALIVFNVVL